MTTPGWYQAEGDPPGTTRYWDGAQWVGEPVHTPGAPNTPGGYGAYGAEPGAGLNVASAGARIGGRFIDIIILILLGLLLFLPLIRDIISDIDALGPSPATDQVERVITDAVEDNVGRFAVIGIGGILWDFLWVALVGGTPGKLMLGLRVARADTGKSPPGFGKAALRSLNRLAGLIPLLGGLVWFGVGLASLIMLFADSQSRTVMDRIASTVVIKK